LKPTSVFVTDLDNTLFHPDTERVHSEFFPLLKRWRTLGGTWIIATGRPVHRLHDFFDRWGEVPDYYIARERFMAQYVDGIEFPYLGWNRAMARKTRFVENPPYPWIEDLKELARNQEFDVEFTEGQARFDQIDHARRAESRLNQVLNSDKRAIRNRIYLGVVPKGIGKGRCLNRLVKARKWCSEHILAVGDSANDRDMLDGRYGFRSAAVANAESEAKDWVRSNNGINLTVESGRAVSELLRRLLDRSRIPGSETL